MRAIGKTSSATPRRPTQRAVPGADLALAVPPGCCTAAEADAATTAFLQHFAPRFFPVVSRGLDDADPAAVRALLVEYLEWARTQPRVIYQRKGKGRPAQPQWLKWLDQYLAQQQKVSRGRKRSGRPQTLAPLIPWLVAEINKLHAKWLHRQLSDAKARELSDAQAIRIILIRIGTNMFIRTEGLEEPAAHAKATAFARSDASFRRRVDDLRKRVADYRTRQP